MNLLSKIALFISLFLSFFQLSAQQAVIFENYEIEKSMLLFGLINHIAIDEDNIKWVATEGGLLRIEEGNTEIFNVNNSQIPSNRINVVAVDDSGSKWLGTYNKGLVKMDFGGRFTTFKLENPADGKSHLITSLVIDAKGNKWIGTDAGGLWVLNQNNELKNYNRQNSSLQASQINDIYINKQDEKLIATDIGLYKMKGSLWNVEQSGKEINSLGMDSEENIWLAVQTKESHTVYKNNKVVKNNQFKKMSFQLGDIYLDELSRLWGTSNGLVKYEDKKWTLYNADNSNLTAMRTTCLAMDKEKGVLWLGTQSNGLFTLNLQEDFENARRLAQEEQAVAAQTLKKQKIEKEIEKQKIEKIKKQTVTFQGTKLRKGDSVAIKNIRFDPTSYKLENAESINAVEELTSIMFDNPSLEIELAGHTDINPSPDHKNYEKIKAQHVALSKKRVQIVINYLVERGIGEERIKSKAYGGSHPLSKNNSRKNRRVEVKILKIK